MSLYLASAIGSNNVANTGGSIATMTTNEQNISMVASGFTIGSSIFRNMIPNNAGKKLYYWAELN